MASITIRNLDDGLKARLRIQAAQHGTSMEDEARQILRRVLTQEVQPSVDLGRAIHQRFATLGGVELALPEREVLRAPPDMDS
ncbi:MAG: FitA-like ribbon-helix-helix domain-containing protein [Polyangiales bacterium]